MLRELATDVWTRDQPLGFFGIEIGTRMTVLGLPGSRLLLHSPVHRTPELAAEVEKLGTPAFIVAPNRFHHLYAGEWRDAYPDSRLYVAPGLETKRKDLRITGVLDAAPAPEWADTIDQVRVEGFPLANEVVLFHRPSGTVVASDLLFNITESSPPLTRFAMRLSGAYGRPSSTLLERFFVRDRAAFRRSLEKILAWPIRRIVLAHGEVVESDARGALERAYSWVLAR